MQVDQNIITQCLKGNERSCKQLYELYLPYCYGICKRYGIAHSNVKDQIQNIFSNMFKSLKNFDSNKASFKTWFTRICINNILEERRKKSRQLQLAEVTDTDSTLDFAFDYRVEENMEKDYIMEILSKMPNQYQDVFNMFVIDGYTHKEISVKLGMSEVASRTSLKRGRDWAKKALNFYLQSSH